MTSTRGRPGRQRAAIEAARTQAAELRRQINRLTTEAEVAISASRLEARTLHASALETFSRDIAAVGDKLTAVMSQAPRGTDDAATKTLIAGLEMTEKTFWKVADQHGLTRLIPDADETFRSDAHQAIVGGAREGARIVNVVAPGYAFQGQTIRRADVILEDEPADSFGDLSWLNEADVVGQNGPRSQPGLGAAACVEVAKPAEWRAFDPQAISALSEKLRLVGATPPVSRLERRARTPLRISVALPPLPKIRGSKRALVAATVLVTLLAPALMVRPIRSDHIDEQEQLQTARGIAKPDVSLAYSVRPIPAVPAPRTRPASQHAATAAPLPIPPRQLASRTVPDAPLAALRADDLAEATVVERRPSGVVNSARYLATPDSTAVLGQVLAERTQTSAEVGNLLGGSQFATLSRGAQSAPTRLSLDQDAKQRLSVTLNVKQLR